MDPSALNYRHLSPLLRAELRSDHAGEAGAVMIYKGVLAVTRDLNVQRFAHAHLRTEQKHLEFFEALLPADERSRLLPLWRLSGWLLGAVAACGGASAVYATVAAVERFVVEHYQAQIDFLENDPELTELRNQLRAFQQDEASHLTDADNQNPVSPQLRGGSRALWSWIVDRGSRAAVITAKRI